MLLILLAVSVALIYVWSHISITRISYEMARELSRKKNLEQEKQRLLVEIESLRRLKRIEGIARVELGMLPPERDQVVFVK